MKEKKHQRCMSKIKILLGRMSRGPGSGKTADMLMVFYDQCIQKQWLCKTLAGCKQKENRDQMMKTGFLWDVIKEISLLIDLPIETVA